MTSRPVQRRAFPQTSEGFAIIRFYAISSLWGSLDAHLITDWVLHARAGLTCLLPGPIYNPMNRELIRQQLKGQKPLVIRTSDGKEFSVPHPEFVLVGRHNIVVESERGLLDII